jgi:hypothetical protein
MNPIHSLPSEKELSECPVSLSVPTHGCSADEEAVKILVFGAGVIGVAYA